jgi:glutamyl-tRNA synthetase
LETAGRKPALRIRVPKEQVSFVDGNYGPYTEQLEKECGDFILRRSDGIFAYQLAVVVDDGLMGVTRVVRGHDLLSSTPRQLWLQSQLGFSTPHYCHTPLLIDSQGRRLSKRDRDLDMGKLRAVTTPERLLGILAHLAGILDRPDAISAPELVPLFSWEQVGRADRVIREDVMHSCLPNPSREFGAWPEWTSFLSEKLGLD